MSDLSGTSNAANTLRHPPRPSTPSRPLLLLGNIIELSYKLTLSVIYFKEPTYVLVVSNFISDRHGF